MILDKINRFSCILIMRYNIILCYYLSISTYQYYLYHIEPCLSLTCRTVSVQKSSDALGLLLLGVSGRLTLSCIYSRLCSGGFLHGLRVNIHRQHCVARHQPETEGSNWRNEGEGCLKGILEKFNTLLWAEATLDMESQFSPVVLLQCFTVKIVQRNRLRDAQHKIYWDDFYEEKHFVYILMCICDAYSTFWNITSCDLGRWNTWDTCNGSVLPGDRATSCYHAEWLPEKWSYNIP